MHEFRMHQSPARPTPSSLGLEIKLETRELNEYSTTRLNSARTRTLMSRAKLAFLAH
jgi:hypothetical protein